MGLNHNNISKAQLLKRYIKCLEIEFRSLFDRLSELFASDNSSERCAGVLKYTLTVSCEFRKEVNSLYQSSGQKHEHWIVFAKVCLTRSHKICMQRKNLKDAVLSNEYSKSHKVTTISNVP